MGLPAYKDIVDLLKKGATVEAQEKVMELREAALELQEENIELNKKVKELQEALEVKGSIVYEPPYYFIEKDGKKDGPFCQNCYDSGGKLIRLQEQQPKKGRWTCHCCNKNVKDSNYKLPSFQRSPGRR